MAYRRRRRGFGGAMKSPVMQEQKVAKKRGKCRACKAAFEAGDNVVRLRLRKAYRQPCALCNHKLLGVRWYHVGCVPIDLNAAMGYDPNGGSHNNHTAPPPPPSSSAHQVPPPPKPMTVEEKQMAALTSIVAVVQARCASNPTIKAQLADTFKTFQGCTARSLRPGTPQEGLVALKMALKKALDLVF